MAKVILGKESITESESKNVMLSTVILYCKYCESGVLKKAGFRGSV